MSSGVTGSADVDLQPPDELRTEEFLLRPIRVADAELDHDAVMETRVSLRRWEQSSWPEDDFTVEANRADMELLERRFADGESFTYTVMDPAEARCLGCVYVVPTRSRQLTKYRVTPVGDADWSQFTVGVYYWVRESRLEDGLDGRLLEALARWFRGEWRIENFLFVTNELCDQQMTMIQNAGFELRFELTTPKEAATSLAYG
jgi:hypothetical protein